MSGKGSLIRIFSCFVEAAALLDEVCTEGAPDSEGSRNLPSTQKVQEAAGEHRQSLRGDGDPLVRCWGMATVQQCATQGRGLLGLGVTHPHTTKTDTAATPPHTHCQQCLACPAAIVPPPTAPPQQ